MSLRMHLRHATAACHERVDAAFSAFDLATPDGYAGFLVAQSAALGPVEQALERVGITDILPDWRERSRRAALGRDLASLGQAHSPPVPVAPPAGAAAALGMAYVLEGSRLGSVVLLRRVLAGPDLASREATDYLRHGAGEDFWRRFLARLETLSLPEADLAKMTAGAVAAFTAFERAAMAMPRMNRQLEKAENVASGH